MKNINKQKKQNTSIYNQSTKYTASQTEANEEKIGDYIHKYALTETSKIESNLLDYIFVNNKNLIMTQTKDPLKIKNYYNDLEQTLEINLDILYRLDYNFEKKEQINEIKLLIKNIIEKSKNRKKNIKKQKELKSSLFNKKQAIIEMKTKNNESKENLIKRENNDILLLNSKKKYIKTMFNNLSDLEDYLQILKLKTEIKNGNLFKNINNNQKNEIALSDFFRKNTNLMREIKLYKSDIQKLNDELIELKKDNQLYKEETKLYKAKKQNKDLIRVMEFYRRIIRSLQTKIKILRNSFDNMTKTLNYLNLGDIVNFNIYKKDLNTTHYEIDFNDLHDDDNKEFNLIEKINGLMNFKKYLK